MNNKLKHYPDLAAAADLTAVSDCTSARKMYAAYAKYLGAHPGFDRDEPIDSQPEPLPQPPVTPGTAEVPKIFNGTTASDPRVVSISYTTDISSPVQAERKNSKGVRAAKKVT
jgi:hypothetical protein